MLVKTCDQNHEGGGGKMRMRREERGEGRSMRGRKSCPQSTCTFRKKRSGEQN